MLIDRNISAKEESAPAPLFTCQIPGCFKTFTNQNSLNFHTYRVHLGIDSSLCNKSRWYHSFLLFQSYYLVFASVSPISANKFRFRNCANESKSSKRWRRFSAKKNAKNSTKNSKSNTPNVTSPRAIPRFLFSPFCYLCSPQWFLFPIWSRKSPTSAALPAVRVDSPPINS